MENRNRLRDFLWCPSFFIDNRLPSRMYVISRSRFPSYLRQRRSSDMMKLQGLIAIMQSLFGGRRPMFGFVSLPFVGVVLFPSPAFDGVRSGNTFGGGGVFRGNASSPAFYVMPLLPSFLFFRLPFSLSGGFCLKWLFADCNFQRCRERFC